MASAPDAQALTVVCTPACAPSSMAIQPADPFGMSMGTVNGESRCQPFSLRVSYADRVEATPPMPLDTTTPSRSGATSGLPAWLHASRAATRANCSQRSSRRACTRSMSAAGSAAAHAAIRVGSSAAQSSVSGPTPLRPSSSESQVLATSVPTGVIAPSPVTTTRVLSVVTLVLLLVGCSLAHPTRATPAGTCPGDKSGSHAGAADVVDHVLDRLEVLELVVGDLDAELVLRGDGDLHHGQRVDVEVVNERLVGRYLVGRHSGNLVDDLAQTLEDLLLRHGHWSCSPSACCSLLASTNRGRSECSRTGSGVRAP